MADVFLSYSRRNKEFVHQLYEFLTGKDKDVWVDWDDIPPASEWQQDIAQNIEGADGFVFVVSADSLASAECAKELEHALGRGKRIVPIACDHADPTAARDELRNLNWIWCVDGDDQGSAFEAVLKGLDTDLAWVHAHTRVLVRAVEWDQNERNSSFLLRGNDLKDAEHQLAAGAAKDPPPTELQSAYILVSRQNATRRQRMLLGGVSLALIVAVGLGVLALLQRNTAVAEAATAQSQALAAQAGAALQQDPASGLALAVRAMERKRTPQARLALRQALLANPIVWTDASKQGHPMATPLVPVGVGVNETVDSPRALAFSPDGRLIAVVRPDGTLRVHRSTDGSTVATAREINSIAFAPHTNQLIAAGNRVALVFRPGGVEHRWIAPSGTNIAATAFTSRGPVFAVGGAGGGVRIAGPRVRTVRLHGGGLTDVDASFSAGGNRLVTLGTDDQGNTVAQVWAARTGKVLFRAHYTAEAVLAPNGRSVVVDDASGGGAEQLVRVPSGRVVAKLPSYGVEFDHSGRLLANFAGNGSATVWDTRTGRLVTSLPGFGGQNGGGAAFSQDDRLLALGGGDGIVRVFELASGSEIASVASGWSPVLAFAPHAPLLASETWDGMVAAARSPAGISLRTGFHPRENGCDLAQFNPLIGRNGSLVAAPARSGSIGVWALDGRRVATIPKPHGAGPNGGPDSFALDANGKLAVASFSLACNVIIPGAHGSWGVWRVGARSPFWSIPTNSPLNDSVTVDRSGALATFGNVARRLPSAAKLPALHGLVAISPDGRFALLPHPNHALAIVNSASGKPVVRLADVGAHPVQDAQFSPDDHRLVASTGGPLSLWNARTGARIGILRGTRSYADASFGAGGKLLLVPGSPAEVFRTSDGKLLATAPAAAAISPNGAFAVVMGANGAVKIVDMQTGLATSLQADTRSTITSVAFAARNVLVLGDGTGDVHLVKCTICASDNALLSRARSDLRLFFGYDRQPAGLGETG